MKQKTEEQRKRKRENDKENRTSVSRKTGMRQETMKIMGRGTKRMK